MVESDVRSRVYKRARRDTRIPLVSPKPTTKGERTRSVRLQSPRWRTYVAQPADASTPYESGKALCVRGRAIYLDSNFVTRYAKVH